MRMNYINELNSNTRCRVLNDPTSYMAHHYFKYSNETVKPSEEFTIVDSIIFKLNSSSRAEGLLLHYEGTLKSKDLYMVYCNGSYKMFYYEDMSTILNELDVESLNKNKIFNTAKFEVLNGNKDNIVIFDAFEGLLANKSDEEILTFFEENGTLLHTVTAIKDQIVNVYKVDKTDYYYKLERGERTYVFHKNFKDTFYSFMKSDELDNLYKYKLIKILISSYDTFMVSECGKYLKKGEAYVKLNDTFKECIGNSIKGYKLNYFADLTLEIEEELKNGLVKEITKHAIGDVKFISVEEYFNNLKAKDIFHLFIM